MMIIRTKTIFLGACIAEAAWLLLAQVLGNTMLLLPCLGCFLALVVWAALKNMAMPVILFFLPFAPLLKIQPGTISFFTIALLAVYLVYLVTDMRQISVEHMAPALCLLALILVVKTAYGYTPDNTFILFCITLLLIPYLARDLEGSYSFYWLTLFFVLGISFSAITAQYLVSFPPISRYIDINTTLGVIRRSGYYGDPNFYSAHITSALGGVLLLLLNNDKKRKLIALFLMVLVLIYCGLMSISKSFLLVCLFLFLLWFADMLFRRGAISQKVVLILISFVAIIFFLSSTLFTDMLGEGFARFNQDSSLSDFTTGRTDLWVRYISAIIEDPWLFLFGQGYTDVTVGGRMAHNTLIQSVFQFGLVGCALFAAWVILFLRALLRGVKIRWNSVPQVVLLLVGVFGPWMALDYLFFDELFLLPVYVCAALRFLANPLQGESPLLHRANETE